MAPELMLSNAERDVLQVLWELGSATVREIRRALQRRDRQWAPTTVNTLLTRLELKQYVVADRSEFAHRFRPLVSRDAIVQQHLQELADKYCNGQTTPLILALVESQSLSNDDVLQLRALLDQLEQQPRRGSVRTKKRQTEPATTRQPTRTKKT
jgi:predicted transcriptional regulator